LGSILSHVPAAPAASPPTASVFATKITSNNAAKYIRTGPDAIGGIGDWFITNGTLCACGRADDHFSFTHDLLQGSRRRPLDSNQIQLEQEEGSASIIVTGDRDGAQIVTRYTLNDKDLSEIHIDKRLTTSDIENFNFFSLLNFNYHSLESFVLNSKEIELNNGFKAEDFVSRGLSAISIAARNADTIVTLSPPTAEHGIAYGWHLASAERVNSKERYPVPRYMMADDSSTAMLVMTDTFYFGSGRKIGWLQVPQIPLLKLDQESAIETKEIIFVGKHGDISSVTNQLFKTSNVINGRVSELNSAIHIKQENGAPFSHIRPREDGSFSFRAPNGRYQLTLRGTANRQTEIDIEVNNQTLDLGDIKLPTPSRLQLPMGKAMRLVFIGLDGTPNPNFADTLTGFSVIEEDGENFVDPVSNIFLAGLEGDLTSVELVPGKYRVYATRGPEYSLEKTELFITEKQTTTLNIKTPKRLLDTPKYIASDLHVHSGLSFDNAFSERERVRTFVAEHGEVMVSSEHDLPVDYAPRIREMGAQGKIVSIAAAEITSLFFPYPPAKHQFRRGMVNHENQRWRDIISNIRKQHPEIISQLNHARLNLNLSGELPHNWEDHINNGQFFDHMGSAAHPYDPSKPLHSHPNNILIEAHEETGVRDIDFDLIEIINPGGIHHEDRIKAHRKDWLSLLKQGEKLVGTANSDSHRASKQVAVPRTMVALSDDRISHFRQREFLAELKSGNAYGTTGPMINISLSGAQMGQTFAGARGQLSLSVESADWIAVDTIKIQINGETVDQYQLKPQSRADRTSRHNLLIPLSFNKDSFVTVEISGPIGEDYAHIYPELAPYAFSNPIYVDYDNSAAPNHSQNAAFWITRRKRVKLTI